MRLAPRVRSLVAPRVRSFIAALLVALPACGGSPPAPATPTEAPPLPPASGTPIGVLVDDSGELHLRDDQVSQLREIDEQLSARNDAIDAQLAERGAPVGGDAPGGGGGGGGGRHHGGGGRGGGMGGGGMGGGGMGGGGMGGGGGRHHRGGGGAPSGDDAQRPKPSAASQNELHEQRMANTKDAMTRAFALLDAGQQAAARKLLADRGIDLTGAPPTSEPEGPSAPTDNAPDQAMPPGEP